MFLNYVMNSIYFHTYYNIKFQICVDLLYCCECVYMYGWVVEEKTEKTKIIVNPVSTLKLFFENTMNKCE